MFFTAVLAAANTALLELADVAGPAACAGDRDELAAWAEREKKALAGRFDAVSGLCSDYDVRTGQDIGPRMLAWFALLFGGPGPFGGTAEGGQLAAQLRVLDGGDFCGNQRLRWRVLPSTSPSEAVFQPRNYWRGPTWPIINWLLWDALSRLGRGSRAEELRRESLDQIAAGGEFAEYFEPFTGEPLGSTRQSWTAAVTLDWLAAG